MAKTLAYKCTMNGVQGGGTHMNLHHWYMNSSKCKLGRKFSDMIKVMCICTQTGAVFREGTAMESRGHFRVCMTYLKIHGPKSPSKDALTGMHIHYPKNRKVICYGGKWNHGAHKHHWDVAQCYKRV